MLFLATKIVLSISTVFGLAWIAENVNSRVAGIVAGMPIGTVFVLLFVGIEHGDTFAIEATKSASPAVTTIIAFAFGYYYLSFIKSRLSVFICGFGGVGCYFLSAYLFSILQLSFFSGFLVSLAAIIICAYSLYSKTPSKITRRAPMTTGLILLRAGLATLFVIAIIGFAEILGPLWSGLLTGFPMTLLPFLAIIHVTYPANFVQNIIRSLPLGLGSLLMFLLVVKAAIPLTGSTVAIAIGLISSVIYMMLLGQTLKYAQAGSSK